jgi:hypothetical protein
MVPEEVPEEGSGQVFEHRPRLIAIAHRTLGSRDGHEPFEVPVSVMRFTIVDGRITAIDVDTSAERLRQIVVP